MVDIIGFYICLGLVIAFSIIFGIFIIGFSYYNEDSDERMICAFIAGISTIIVVIAAPFMIWFYFNSIIAVVGTLFLTIGLFGIPIMEISYNRDKDGLTGSIVSIEGGLYILILNVLIPYIINPSSGYIISHFIASAVLLPLTATKSFDALTKSVYEHDNHSAVVFGGIFTHFVTYLLLNLGAAFKF